MKRLLLWAATIGDRLMRTTVDKRVCRISNDLSGDERDE